MKKFLIVVLMVLIVGGTVWGVKYEIDQFNAKNSSSETSQK